MPDMAAEPLQEFMAPIFTGPVGVVVGVVLGVGVGPGVGVSVGTGVEVGVAVGANVAVGVDGGAVVFSPPPQAGNSRTNKLNTSKDNQSLLHFNMCYLPISSKLPQLGQP
jgi:hypothetical protein